MTGPHPGPPPRAGEGAGGGGAGPLLTVNNIEVIYNHVILVLKGVSLEVAAGGIVALLGGTAPARQRRCRRPRTCCVPNAAR
jgi:hypothetical protein